MTMKQGELFFHGIRGEIQISNEEWKKAILQSGVEFPASNDPIGWIKFVETSKSLTQRFISPSLRELGYKLTSPMSELDAVIFDNLPHLNPGRPPLNGGRPPDKNQVSEMVLVGTPVLFGLQLFSYIQEKCGDLVHQVAPTAEKAVTQSNEGRIRFGYHTDDGCFFPFHPEFLFLIGLINEEVATLLLTLDEIIRQTPAELIALLRTPIFTFGSPTSFDFGNGRCLSQRRPIIYKDEYGVDRICLPGIDSIQFQFDSQARAILQQFHDHLDSLTPHKIIIKPGRILAFRNDRAIHGREPIPNENERWLQRIYATNSIGQLRKTTGATPLDCRFDARLLFGLPV